MLDLRFQAVFPDISANKLTPRLVWGYSKLCMRFPLIFPTIYLVPSMKMRSSWLHQPTQQLDTDKSTGTRFQSFTLTSYFLGHFILVFPFGISLTKFHFREKGHLRVIKLSISFSKIFMSDVLREKMLKYSSDLRWACHISFSYSRIGHFFFKKNNNFECQRRTSVSSSFRSIFFKFWSFNKMVFMEIWHLIYFHTWQPCRDQHWIFWYAILRG